MVSIFSSIACWVTSDHVITYFSDIFIASGVMATHPKFQQPQDVAVLGMNFSPKTDKKAHESIRCNSADPKSRPVIEKVSTSN